MKSKLFLLVSAVIALVIAVLMLGFSIQFLNWFLKSALSAGALDKVGAAVGLTGFGGDMLGLVKLGFSFFGAVLVGFALIRYFASSATASVLRWKVILGLAVADLLGLVLTLMVALSGKFNGFIWVLVAIWLLLVLFEAYFLFVKKQD